MQSRKDGGYVVVYGSAIPWILQNSSTWRGRSSTSSLILAETRDLLAELESAVAKPDPAAGRSELLTAGGRGCRRSVPSRDPSNPAKSILRLDTGPESRNPAPESHPSPGRTLDEAEPFDTLGYDAQPEGVTEVDDRSDEVLLPTACVTELEARRERTIELDLADRKVAQVREGREPDTEVIDRHHDARVRQTLNDFASIGSGRP